MPVDTSRKTLDLLVLGGTSWLGGAVAAAAAERGHRVSCLARGESGTPPEGVTWVRADRTAAGGVRRGRRARLGRRGRRQLAARPGPLGAAGAPGPGPALGLRVLRRRCTPTTPRPAPARRRPLLPAHEGDGSGRGRGLRRRQGRLRAGLPSALGPDRVLLARAGLIGGYGDRSDRLGYWPARVTRAGDGEPVLVPPRDDPVQVIDVEDLARWLVAAPRTGPRACSTRWGRHDARRGPRGSAAAPGSARRSWSRRTTGSPSTGRRAVDRAPSRCRSGCRSRSTPGS